MADQAQLQLQRDTLKKVLTDAGARIAAVEKTVDAMGPYELAEAKGASQVLVHLFEDAAAPGGAAMLFDANGIC